MKKLMLLLTALCLAVASVPMFAAAEGENGIEILKDNVIVYEGYSGYHFMYIAQVRNKTDTPLYLYKGTMSVLNDDGTELAAAKYWQSCSSRYLEPGEISFVCLQADLEENVTPLPQYVVNIETQTEGYFYPDVAVTVVGAEYTVDQSNRGRLRVTVANESDEPLPGIAATAVLEDADGNLLYMTTSQLYYNELGPHSTFTIVSNADSSILAWCQTNGVIPCQVEGIAFVEIDN